MTYPSRMKVLKASQDLMYYRLRYSLRKLIQFYYELSEIWSIQILHNNVDVLFIIIDLEDLAYEFILKRL